MTSQAERPSARCGVREIFLSLSASGRGAQDRHRAVVMEENGGKTPKLSSGQKSRIQGERGRGGFWYAGIFECELMSLKKNIFECKSGLSN